VSRVLPYPGLSLAIAAMWLLLQDSLAPLTLLAAALIGFAAPFGLATLRVPPARTKRFVAFFRLVRIVIYDIVRSNFAVASIILSGARRQRESGFVPISLDLTNRYGLALLAVIITSTPGTLWAEHHAATNRLLLHVFDLVDENDWIELVKGRYEPLLMEIFE
jgi:multicomponent K+:H+ antiporter subunit E